MDSRLRLVETHAGRRLIETLLFVTIVSSPFVMFEPAPYEALSFLFGFACVAAGVALNLRLLPMFFLLLAWGLGGALSLVQVANDSDAVIYFGVSLYLQMTSVLFACVFADDTMRRLAILRRAYILAAMLGGLIAIVGFFRLVPFADMFLSNGRASATFKDPNVFGPFLVLPLLLLIQSMIERGIKVRYAVALVLVLCGLFLSFSRGAWGHFAASAALMIWLMFCTARPGLFRTRIIVFVGAALVGFALLLQAMLSFSVVGDMFVERANLVNYYDGGETGRFGRQAQGFVELANYPNGLGPRQFGKHFGQDPHNVYLNGFYSYGWLGGHAYLALVVLTLVVGFRACLVRTPWQTFLIAGYATFVGLAAEGLIIDTDHWRHFFLLVGLVWGLVAATERVRPRPAAAVNSRAARPAPASP